MRIGVALALTLALLADVAPAQKADVPQIKVGDRWQFVLSVPSTALNLCATTTSGRERPEAELQHLLGISR